MARFKITKYIGFGPIFDEWGNSYYDMMVHKKDAYGQWDSGVYVDRIPKYYCDEMPYYQVCQQYKFVGREIFGRTWTEYATVCTDSPWNCSRSPGAPSIIKAYPNPVSDILTVEIDLEAVARAKANEQTITDGKQLKLKDPVYDIRLYDGRGNLLRQATTKGGAVEFNVSHLIVGVYYLHVYDGVSETPEMLQIVVER